MIDGLNVARATSFHGVDGLKVHHLCEEARAREKPVGRAQAIMTAIEDLLSRGFEVQAILPVWALDGGKRTLLGSELLLPYVGRCLHLSPTGTDDDEFILQLARRRGGYVLSNDLFRDHVARHTITKAWVMARRVSYMFVQGAILTVMPRLTSQLTENRPLAKKTKTTSQRTTQNTPYPAGHGSFIMSGKTHSAISKGRRDARRAINYPSVRWCQGGRRPHENDGQRPMDLHQPCARLSG